MNDYITLQLAAGGEVRMSTAPENQPLGNRIMDYRFSWVEIQACIAAALVNGQIDQALFQAEMRKIAAR